MRKAMSALLAVCAVAALAARADDPDPEPPRPAKVKAKATPEEILKACPKDEDAVGELFKDRLGRKPNEKEKKTALGHLQKAGRAGRLKAFKDLDWAITNSREYLDHQKAKGKGQSKMSKVLGQKNQVEKKIFYFGLCPLTFDLRGVR